MFTIGEIDITTGTLFPDAFNDYFSRLFNLFASGKYKSSNTIVIVVMATTTLFMRKCQLFFVYFNSCQLLGEGTERIE